MHGIVPWEGKKGDNFHGCTRQGILYPDPDRYHSFFGNVYRTFYYCALVEKILKTKYKIHNKVSLSQVQKYKLVTFHP